MKTADQLEVDALMRKHYRRLALREGATKEQAATEEADSPSCEVLSTRLSVVASYFNQLADALLDPIANYKVLLKDLPVLNKKYPGTSMEDLLADAEAVGRVCKKAVAKRRKAK